jgi:myosin-7
MAADAVQFFKNIRGFMGDRKSKKTAFEHADKIIKVVLLSSQELRDELFCQICKQLNKNPSKESIIRGWQLFIICLTSASPSNELMLSLFHFFKKYMEKEPDLASFVEDTLHKCYLSCQLHGSRCEKPSTAEMSSIVNVRSSYYTYIYYIYFNHRLTIF